MGDAGNSNMANVAKNSLMRKSTAIRMFLRRAEKILEKEMPEEGYSDEMLSYPYYILTKDKVHIDEALKWPG